jgi:prephenate dehydrogenase
VKGVSIMRKLTGDNQKYGKMITDSRYIQNVIEDMQDEINNHPEWTEDGAKETILDKLDELEIYPEDIDYIMSELEF